MSKVVLVTGASSGLGRATASLLANKGYRVYGTSRTSLDIDNVVGIVMDVTNLTSVHDGIKSIIDIEGHIDVVVNNAGMGIAGAIELATEEEIHQQMQTNFMGVVHVCRSVLPFFRKQGSGIFIQISSIGGRIGLPYQGYYSCSKFAIEGFSEALASETSQFGIKTVIIEPGDFATNFTARRTKSENTMANSDYSKSFSRAIGVAEQEENNGLKPVKVAQTIERIIRSKNPKLRYVVANTEQRMSLILKSLLPDRWFVKILSRYYKV